MVRAIRSSFVEAKCELVEVELIIFKAVSYPQLTSFKQYRRLLRPYSQI